MKKVLSVSDFPNLLWKRKIKTNTNKHQNHAACGEFLPTEFAGCGAACSFISWTKMNDYLETWNNCNARGYRNHIVQWVISVGNCFISDTMKFAMHLKYLSWEFWERFEISVGPLLSECLDTILSPKEKPFLWWSVKGNWSAITGLFPDQCRNSRYFLHMSPCFLFAAINNCRY